MISAEVPLGFHNHWEQEDPHMEGNRDPKPIRTRVVVHIIRAIVGKQVVNALPTEKKASHGAGFNAVKNMSIRKQDRPDKDSAQLNTVAISRQSSGSGQQRNASSPRSHIPL